MNKRILHPTNDEMKEIERAIMVRLADEVNNAPKIIKTHLWPLTLGLLNFFLNEKYNPSETVLG